MARAIPVSAQQPPTSPLATAPAANRYPDGSKLQTQYSPVNAHQISIDYDGKTAVLNLGTGDTAALQGPSHDPAQRLIEISKTVKGVTGNE